jgi:hypothetical protein
VLKSASAARIASVRSVIVKELKGELKWLI